MFNSIGAIGLLVLVGVLLTTATAPAKSWHDPIVRDYAPNQSDAGLAPRPPSEPYHPTLIVPR